MLHPFLGAAGRSTFCPPLGGYQSLRAALQCRSTCEPSAAGRPIAASRPHVRWVSTSRSKVRRQRRKVGAMPAGVVEEGVASLVGRPPKQPQDPPPHTLLFRSDRRSFIRPMGIAAVLQAGAWGLFLGNGGLQLLPGLTTGLVTVASLGFPVAIGVYARHYVCELSLVRRPQMPESLEVCTHTFGGGYFVD